MDEEIYNLLWDDLQDVVSEKSKGKIVCKLFYHLCKNLLVHAYNIWQATQEMVCFHLLLSGREIGWLETRVGDFLLIPFSILDYRITWVYFLVKTTPTVERLIGERKGHL